MWAGNVTKTEAFIKKDTEISKNYITLQYPEVLQYAAGVPKNTLRVPPKHSAGTLKLLTFLIALRIIFKSWKMLVNKRNKKLKGEIELWGAYCSKKKEKKQIKLFGNLRGIC